MKILHRIKFYGFTVAGRAIKLKSVNFYYYVAKTLSTVEPVYYGHLGTSKKCSDYQRVLIFRDLN